MNSEILVDEQDAWLLHFPWAIDRSSAKTAYARCSITRDGWTKRILLHRAIMQPGPDQVVDHINGNGLDNRRSNLRICSRAENNRNFRPHGKTSKFKGVSWRTKDRCWVMQIHVPDSPKKRITEIFPADQEEQAARRYDHWAREFHKEFAFLNFPPLPPCKRLRHHRPTRPRSEYGRIMPSGQSLLMNWTRCSRSI